MTLSLAKLAARLERLEQSLGGFVVFCAERDPSDPHPDPFKGPGLTPRQWEAMGGQGAGRLCLSYQGRHFRQLDTESEWQFCSRAAVELERLKVAATVAVLLPEDIDL